MSAHPQAALRDLPAQALEVLARVPSLAGAHRITALPGGLTNQNFKVVTDAGSYVARLWSDGGEGAEQVGGI